MDGHPAGPPWKRKRHQLRVDLFGGRSPPGLRPLELSRARRSTSLVMYDEGLADRIRELIGTERDLTEKKMFGGLA
ncbi:MAG: hypothetical protein ACRDOE_20200, partial [Streptosporangiaceae bacterium]